MSTPFLATGDLPAIFECVFFFTVTFSLQLSIMSVKVCRRPVNIALDKYCLLLIEKLLRDNLCFH